MRQTQFIFLIMMLAALFFLAENTFGSLDADIVPKDIPSAGSQASNKYFLNAGQNLEIAAGLRYTGLGLGIAGLAISRYGDESDLGLDRVLQCGSAVIFISPYYVGRAGKELSKVRLDVQMQEAGTALQKYRSSYYGGIIAVVLGTGLTALQTDDSGRIACATLAVGGLLYSIFAPPHYLRSAGSHLSKADILSNDANLLIHEVGGNLGDAGVYQYTSIFSYLLGGIITIGSIISDDDSGIIMGGCFLGLGVISDLFSAIRISCAGRGLYKASKMQLE